MKQFSKVLAVLLALSLLFSLTVLPVFADEGDDGQTPPVQGEGGGLGLEKEGDVEDNTQDFDELFNDSEGNPDEDPTGAGSETENSADAENATEDTAAPETTTTTDGLSTETIVWLIVLGVALVAGIVLGIIFRKKIAKFFVVYKSELKKVVWLPWDQTKKSTLVVLVVLIVCAAVICLVDLGLQSGFGGILTLAKG